MSMKDRFEGEEGRTNLISALRDQEIVEHRDELAIELSSVGDIIEFADRDTIIEQGQSDNSAYFILAGQVNVFVNHRLVESRGPRQVVGEMVTIDPSAPRSATVKADGDVVTHRITGAELSTIADRNSSIWRVIARSMAESLRMRERFHRPKNKRPLLFIGCSTEGLAIAQEVQKWFKHVDITARIWTDGVFGPGGVPIDNLLEQVNEADFALFVFTPDDKLTCRDADFDAPRDNVVFEMGMFIARLGRTRVFMIREHRIDLKIPSDLLGITPVTYVSDDNDSLVEQLGPPCSELKALFQGLGAF